MKKNFFWKTIYQVLNEYIHNFISIKQFIEKWKKFCVFGSEIEKKKKVEFNNIPLNHSKNIYFFNSEKRRIFNSKKKHYNKKKIKLIKKIENEKDLKERLIIENLKTTKINKELFPIFTIESFDNAKINKEEKLQTEPYNNKSNYSSNKITRENWYYRFWTKYNNKLFLEFDRDKNLNKRAFISSIPEKERSFGYKIEK